MTTLHFTTNCDVLPPLLKGDVPEGVRVSAAPVMRHRTFDVQITTNIDFSIAIDGTKIAGMLVAAWLLRHVRHFKRPIRIELEGKLLPADDGEATKMITDAIAKRDKEGSANPKP